MKKDSSASPPHRPMGGGAPHQGMAAPPPPGWVKPRVGWRASRLVNPPCMGKHTTATRQTNSNKNRIKSGENTQAAWLAIKSRAPIRKINIKLNFVKTIITLFVKVVIILATYLLICWHDMLLPCAVCNDVFSAVHPRVLSAPHHQSIILRPASRPKDA